MNHRHFLSSVLVIALVLFAFPIVSPVPAQDPAVEVLRDPNASSQPYPFTNGTVQYQNLSPDAQQWFDDLPQSEESFKAETIPIDSPPEPWASFVPNGSETNVQPANEQIDEVSDVRRRFWSIRTYVQVEKDDRYHLVILARISPHPPQQAVALRLGSLVGSIGLFGLAGQQWLTKNQ
ncbi:hypothetical protein [Halocatena marina]|uniref:Uncharacterized protein n=1 Tax=Halocatena marina TaxID=2934937 RepID=A0ABD5YZF1_9EURY|nr:hypothetical protein [Halocatena marina]